jgi:hypothetical protein
MKKYLIIPVLFLVALNTEADESASARPDNGAQYMECVGVSLHTMQGKELNSTVKNNRMVKDTNAIPKGWTVIGTTEKTEAGVISPFLVICH